MIFIRSAPPRPSPFSKAHVHEYRRTDDRAAYVCQCGRRVAANSPEGQFIMNTRNARKS